MRIAPALTALSLAMLAPVAMAQNMLANPSFESGFTGWTQFGNAFVDPANPPAVTPRTGNNVLKMFGNFSGGFNVTGCFQAFPAAPGQQFTMDCWSRNSSADPMQGVGLPNDNWVVMKIAFFDAGHNEIGNAEGVVLDGNSIQDVWIDNPAITGTAPANTASVEAFLLFLQPAFLGGSCQIDDVEFSGPPQQATRPGSGEDLRLLSGIGGASPTTGPGQDVKVAVGGSLMELKVASPNGAFSNSPYYLIGSLAATGTPPAPALPFTDIWVDLNSYFILVGSFSPIGAPVVGPNGSSSYWLAPAGFPSISLVVQALAISPSAANGLYAATDAHEIQFQ